MKPEPIKHYRDKRDHKQPYRKSRASDPTCRCNGSCSYCRSNRLHKNRKREPQEGDDHDARSNPQHLPPEKSAREYESKVADLTAKLQAVCPHALRHHQSNGYEFRIVCPICGLASDWQYRDSRNSRELLRDLWQRAVDTAKDYLEEVQP